MLIAASEYWPLVAIIAAVGLPSVRLAWRIARSVDRMVRELEQIGRHLEDHEDRLRRLEGTR